jgi:hypothetical protein
MSDSTSLNSRTWSDSSIAYSRIDIDELGTGTCLQVWVRLENAVNAYAGTVSRWNDCIYDLSCDRRADPKSADEVG